MKAVALWGDRVLWPEDVADMFGVSAVTVKRWVRMGYLTTKKAGRRYYFTTDDIRAFSEHGTAGIMKRQAEVKRVRDERAEAERQAWLKSPEGQAMVREADELLKAAQAQGGAVPSTPTPSPALAAGNRPEPPTVAPAAEQAGV